jgi:hypothetical protein
VYHFRDLASAGTAPAFSAEEAIVLQLAQHEGACSVRTPGRFARFVAWLFAVRHAGPLANARLEALRRAAILARIEGKLPERDAAALIGFGFSPAQLAVLGTA